MKTKSIFKVRNLKSPRVIKTHLALEMLPKQACVFIVFFLSLFEFCIFYFCVCVCLAISLYLCHQILIQNQTEIWPRFWRSLKFLLPLLNWNDSVCCNMWVHTPVSCAAIHNWFKANFFWQILAKFCDDDSEVLNHVKVLNAWVPCAFDNLSEYPFQCKSK